MPLYIQAHITVCGCRLFIVGLDDQILLTYRRADRLSAVREVQIHCNYHHSDTMLDKLSVHTPIQWQSLWLSQEQELAYDIITAKLVLQKNLLTAPHFTRNEYFVGWLKQKNLGVIIIDMTDQGVTSLDRWHKSQRYPVIYPNLVSSDSLSIQKPRQRTFGQSLSQLHKWPRTTHLVTGKLERKSWNSYQQKNKPEVDPWYQYCVSQPQFSEWVQGRLLLPPALSLNYAL